MRGFAHIHTLLGALIQPVLRQQMTTLLGVMRQSRTAMHKGGLPALMHELDQQAQRTEWMDDSAMRLADMLAALMPLPPFRHCLKRSVLRYVILKSRGDSPTFVIGITRPDRSVLTGHAWVTLNDAAFCEDDDQHQRMTPIFSYPPR